MHKTSQIARFCLLSTVTRSNALWKEQASNVFVGFARKNIHVTGNMASLAWLRQQEQSFVERLQLFRSYSSEISEVDKKLLEVTCSDLKTLLSAGQTRVIDVREPHEQVEFGFIPNAINVPLGELADALAMPNAAFRAKYKAEKPQEDEAFVLHCMRGIRSYKALILAREKGFHKSRHLAGGFVEWKEQNK